MPSRHIAVDVDRPAQAVYDYVRDPANLPAWASGLGGSGELEDGRWVAEAPFGRVAVAFAADNPFGVLDHDVTLPTGAVVRNPLRVLADGAHCEVVFSLRPDPASDEAEHERDAATVLETLKRILESADAAAAGPPEGSTGGRAALASEPDEALSRHHVVP